MKKRLLFGAIAALLLCGGVATASIVSDKDQLSELTKENIGAMRAGFDDITIGKKCNWHSVKNNTFCVEGGKGNRCDCGSTTYPL